jgi:hypothetical protein
MTFTAKRLDFDEVKSAELHDRTTVAMWNLATISAFAAHLF